MAHTSTLFCQIVPLKSCSDRHSKFNCRCPRCQWRVWVLNMLKLWLRSHQQCQHGVYIVNDYSHAVSRSQRLSQHGFRLIKLRCHLIFEKYSISIFVCVFIFISKIIHRVSAYADIRICQISLWKRTSSRNVLVRLVWAHSDFFLLKRVENPVIRSFKTCLIYKLHP